MTIEVAVLISDGIVLAADSRQVGVSASGYPRVDSDSVDKIVPLDSHLAAMISGQAYLYDNPRESPRHMSSILRDAMPYLQKGTDLAHTAESLRRLVAEVKAKHDVTTKMKDAEVLAFHLAGYEGSIGRIYRCTIPGEITLERQTTDAGALWYGQREIIDRLIMGWDSHLAEFLAESSDTTAVGLALEQYLPRLQLHVNFQTMTMQDAAMLADLLASTTVRLQQVSDGIVSKPGTFPSCGGPIDIALITPEDGFRWLRHKVVSV